MINRKTGLIICILLSITFILVFYSENLLNPNGYLFSAKNDGIKSYFNYVNHVKNDTSFFHLGGISYPYGETVFLEDCMPLISNLAKGIAVVFPSFANHSVGLLNLLILFSLAAGAFFMYLVFLRFSVPPLISAISANAAVILSSQFILLSDAGHLGLTFTCFFPAGWYLLLRFSESEHKLKWSVVNALHSLAWAYVHIYLGAILMAFTLLVLFFKLLPEIRNYKKVILLLTGIVIQVFIPLSVIFFSVKFFDDHPDRIEMPFITEHMATFYSTFVPNISPLKPLYELLFDLSPQAQQSWCKVGNYIGFTSNIAIIIFISFAIYYKFRKKAADIFKLISPELFPYLLASIALLLYSMAIPLMYIPEGLVDGIPFIKQFFSLGRFGWAFYYVIIVFGTVLFYNLLNKHKILKYLIYPLVLLYVFEGIGAHLIISPRISTARNPFCLKHLNTGQRVLSQIPGYKFQAIIPLPYYFKYNIPFAAGGSDTSIYSSMVASYHSGLPLTCTFLSRPSVSESMSIFKMLIQKPYRKPIDKIIKDGRPFLIIVANSDSGNLNTNEKEILLSCKEFYKTGDFILLSVSVEDLFNLTGNRHEKEFDNRINNLYSSKGFLVEDTNIFLAHSNFEKSTNPLAYRGSGAFEGRDYKNEVIYCSDTEKMDSLTDYTVSFWYYNYIWDQTFTSVIITESGKCCNNLQYIYYSPLEAQVIDGWWYLSEHTFRIKSTNSILKISVQGNNFFSERFWIDELVIRPSKANIYKVVPGNGTQTVFLNNRELFTKKLAENSE